VAWTDDDLIAIRAARRRGVRTVQYVDRSVTYSSDAELRQLEQDICSELNVALQRPRQAKAVSSKGIW
jgi:hypothetical protein